MGGELVRRIPAKGMRGFSAALVARYFSTSILYDVEPDLPVRLDSFKKRSRDRAGSFPIAREIGNERRQIPSFPPDEHLAESRQ